MEFAMFFASSNKRKKNEKRPPDMTAQVTEHLGIAVWEVRDGYEVKLGQCFEDTDRKTGNKRLIVRQVVPISLYGEAISAMETVARAFGSDKRFDVADNLRANLTDLADRLETVLLPPSEVEMQLNGPDMNRNPFIAAV